MKQWVMACFCLINCICFYSINSYSQSAFRPFFDLEEKVLLKSSLDFFNQHFSGILIIKEIEDHQFRFVFTTEIGVKVFDYEIKNGFAEQQYIMPILDKNLVDKILKRDLAVLIAEFRPKSNVRRLSKNEHSKLTFRNQYGSSSYFSEDSTRPYKAIHRGKLGKKKLIMEAVYDENAQLELIKFSRPGIIKLSGQYTKINQ